MVNHSNHPTNRFRILVRIALGFLVFTAIGLFFSTQIYLLYQQRNGSEGWIASIHSSLVNWYSWAVLVFVVIAFAHRFPIDTGKRLSRVLLHVVSSLVIAMLHTSLCVGWYWLVKAPERTIESWWRAFSNGIVFYFHWDVMIYFAILGFVYANDYYRRLRSREVISSQLEAELHRARLDALRMQVNPHFLFNSLNAVSELVHEDPALADKAINQIAALLRTILDESDKTVVLLRDELDFVKRYLELEQIRFGERLNVNLDVAVAALEVFIPNLLLQPLIENAIRHGISTREAGGTIDILAHVKDGQLKIVVKNSASQKDTRRNKEGGGLGLPNLRERLVHHYGVRFQFELVETEVDFTAMITVPSQSLSDAVD